MPATLMSKRIPGIFAIPCTPTPTDTAMVCTTTMGTIATGPGCRFPGPCVTRRGIRTSITIGTITGITTIDPTGNTTDPYGDRADSIT